MGDRGNIMFSERELKVGDSIGKALDGSLVLYTHWKGSELGPALAAAMRKARPRLADPSYATRIIVSQVIGDEWDGTSGFGLSVGQLSDNEYPVLIVGYRTYQIFAGRFDDGVITKAWSFAEFSDMSDAAAKEAHLTC